MIIIDFKILDKKWKLKVLKNRKYAKKNGADSVGITKGWKREIALPVSGSDIETIIHELVHAYLVEMCTSSIEMTVEALEEIYAELMSKRGRELLDLADKLHAEIQAVLKADIECVQDTRKNRRKI